MDGFGARKQEIQSQKAEVDETMSQITATSGVMQDAREERKAKGICKGKALMLAKMDPGNAAKALTGVDSDGVANICIC